MNIQIITSHNNIYYYDNQIKVADTRPLSVLYMYVCVCVRGMVCQNGTATAVPYNSQQCPVTTRTLYATIHCHYAQCSHAHYASTHEWDIV